MKFPIAFTEIGFIERLTHFGSSVRKRNIDRTNKHDKRKTSHFPIIGYLFFLFITLVLNVIEDINNTNVITIW